MGTFDSFREAALGQGIPAEEVEGWIRLVRPCATLGPDIQGPLVGQFGGRPRLPADAPDPELPFVASVDCAGLPPEATDLPLPPSGQLLFFATTDGLCEVLYVPEGTPVAERAPADDEIEEYPQAELRLGLDVTMDNTGEVAGDTAHVDELCELWNGRPDEGQPTGPIQIGGYPWIWNYNPIEVALAEVRSRADDDAPAERPEDWVMLAEWSADVPDLDLGVIHWLIRRDDLAARRFDRVQGSYDMVG